MHKKTANFTSPADARARASDIGFPFEVLLPTIEVWIAGMNSGTPLHAENYPGTIAWHEAVRTLREEGLAFGLEKLSRENVQLCVCAKTRNAVVIAQGDSRTGDTENLHLKPSTKYPRGPMSCAVIGAQLSLFPQEGKVAKTDPYDVWLLMMHMDYLGNTRAELSLPAFINEQTGSIVDWRERIFLGEFPGDAGMRISSGDDLTPTTDIVIDVKKRG